MNFYLFNFVGNSASSWVSSLASICTLIVTVVIAMFVKNYTHKRWVNDVYARAEANDTIEFRNLLIAIERSLINIIYYFDLINKIEEIPDFAGISFSNHPIKEFKEIDDLIIKAINLHRRLEPFYKNSDIYYSNDSTLISLLTFVNFLIEKLQSKEILIEKSTSYQKETGYYYAIKPENIEIAKKGAHYSTYKTIESLNEIISELDKKIISHVEK